MVNYYGCDSLLTINLDIKKSTSSISRTTCEKWTSPSGKYTWTSTGVYHDTIPNYFGCDSMMTINLTVNKTAYATVPVTACFSYQSPSKKYRWTNTGLYKDTLKTFRGCDSILTVDLVINTVNVGVTKNNEVLTAQTSAGTVQWLNCQNNYALISGETNKIFTATKTGSYAVAVTENSCKDTSNCFAVTVTGVNSFSNNNFRIYPNPNQGIFQVEIPEVCDNATVIVRDITGRIVSSYYYEHLQSAALSIDKGAGLYIVEISSDQFRGKQKMYVD